MNNQSRRGMDTEIGSFWVWFLENEGMLYKFENDVNRIFDKLSNELNKVSEDVTFEFGPIDDDGRREFIISAGGLKSAFPIVEALYESAPTLARWRWIKFRPRQEYPSDISFGGTTILFDDVHYMLVKDKNENKVGILLFFDGYEETKESTFGNIGYLYLDQTLGEYAVETQVGLVRFLSRDSDNFARSRPLTELQEHFDEYCANHLGRL